MTAPDDKIKIPLNESQDDYSQIAEYLKEYKGEGINLAFATDDIFATVDALGPRASSSRTARHLLRHDRPAPPPATATTSVRCASAGS